MHKGLKKVITVLLLVVFLVCTGGNVMAETEKRETSAGAMAGDLALGRPLGLCAMVLGTVVFVISSPFSALGGNFSTAAEKLVVDPTVFTFKRPLGEF